MWAGFEWVGPPFQGLGACGGRKPRALPWACVACPVGAFAITGDLELVTFDRDFTHFTRHGLRLRLLEAKTTETREPKR